MRLSTSKPIKDNTVVWRLDGEENQICIVSKDGFSLPVILNSTASRVFFLCDGRNSIEDISSNLYTEFSLNDLSIVLKDVQEQIEEFIRIGIVHIDNKMPKRRK